MRPTVKLWEVCKIQNGYAFDSKKFNESKWFPLIRIRNIKPNKTDTLFDWDYSKEFLVHDWDFLIGMDWEFNHTLRKWWEALLNQRVCRLYDYKWVLKEYIYYVIWKKLKEIEWDTVAVTVKHISSKQILDIEIPLPPLETQKAIVAKLDQIFAELDQTKSEIQKNLDNTDELRKSALNQAFQGDWEMKKLGEVATVQAWWTPSKEKKEYWENWDIPRLRSECCKNKSIYEAKEFISQSWFEHSSAKLLKKWTTLIALVWATIWKIAYLEFEATTNQNIAWIYPNDKNLDTKYLFNACLTLYKYFEKRWEWKFAMANLSFVKDLQIPVPPLSEQEKIVEHLDQVSKEVKALKSQYQSQLDNLEELKKSVLDKAFRWELRE